MTNNGGSRIPQSLSVLARAAIWPWIQEPGCERRYHQICQTRDDQAVSRHLKCCYAPGGDPDQRQYSPEHEHCDTDPLEEADASAVGFLNLLWDWRQPWHITHRPQDDGLSTVAKPTAPSMRR